MELSEIAAGRLLDQRKHSLANRGSPQPDDTLPLLLTAAETAQLLRTTRTAIYAMVERGQLS